VTRRAYVHRLAAKAPDDVSAFESAVRAGRIDPQSVVAIFGKTEGNGCVNDFTRGFATRALRDALAKAGHAGADDVCLVMSGGTEGAMAPHFLAFEARDVDEAPRAGALAVGRARTPDLPYADLGRLAQVDLVAEGVRRAMRDGDIDDPADVHFVQIKCPLLTGERIAQADAAGARVAVRDTLKSMGLSRAATALGIAVALGEVRREAVREDMIGRDWSVFSSRASTSAGVELIDHEIVVLGASPRWAGPLGIAHAVMADSIDVEPVREALARLGLPAAGQVAARERARIVAVLAKAEASSTGSLRGHRHTMLDDSDISATRHARAFVAGALAGLIGHCEIYVSGGAEHQGPDGGGPVAIIADIRQEMRP